MLAVGCFQKDTGGRMKSQRRFFASLLVAIVGCGMIAANAQTAPDQDRIALQKTSECIRKAFGAGDVESIMKYHHPQVNKALSFHKVLLGREAVAADLNSTFKQFRLEFVKNQVESLLIEKDSAVEQTLFTIRGTPLQGGEPFLFNGRAMVVYVRYPESPTGWASIREIIQSATN
jgi:ketosteroid isomerase-like protein